MHYWLILATAELVQLKSNQLERGKLTLWLQMALSMSHTPDDGEK